MQKLTKVRLILLVFISILSCKTTHAPDEAEQQQVIQHSNAIKFNFDKEASAALQNFQFDLNKLVAKTFIPQIKKATQARFNDTEANRKNLSDLPFYSRLKQFFPESLLKRVRYVVVDHFPKLGEILSSSGINRDQLAKFGVPIDDDVWNFQAEAMTIGDVIYVDKQGAQSISTFFHECVHVSQYDVLGETAFLTQYADAFLSGVHYREIPFEMIAYYLEGFFDKLDKTKNFDAYNYVRNIIAKQN